MSGSTAAPPPEGDTAEPKKSRAGRNLPAAIVVGVLMVGIALASLYWQLWLFVGVIVAAIVIGTDELASAMRSKGIRLTKTPLLAAAVALPVLGYFVGAAQVLMGYGLLFLFTVVWRLFRHGVDDFVRDSTASGFVLAYAPLMGGFAALIAASPDGADRVLTFIALSIGSDIGGYASGVLFGKHPMAAAISPKKSWEGFAGSITLQVILGSVMFVMLLESDWWKGADRRCHHDGDGHPGRLHRVGDQARPRHQGHVQPPAGPWGSHGPPGQPDPEHRGRLHAVRDLPGRGQLT